MKFNRPIALLFMGCLLASHSTRAQADALLDYLTYETFSNTANAGMNAYRELHAERARWANEKSRLQYQIKECGTCSDRAEYEAELEYWTKTEEDFQNIAGGLADLVGMDPLVQNLLGIETGAAISFNTTGTADPWFDFIKSDPPDWYADSPTICQKNYGALMACAQVTQNPRHRDCTDVMKVTEWCAAGAYSDAEDYIHIMALRKSGMQIPEIRDIGWQVEIDFGSVPLGADLIVPSGEDLFEYMSNAQFRRTVQFIFRRKPSGILERADYNQFNALSDFYPDFSRTCGSAKHMYKDPEACSFLHEISNPMKDGKRLPTKAFILSCEYSGEPTVDFWLHEKPDFTRDPRTRRISKKMADAPAADFCPIKAEVANRMWRGQLDANSIKRADYTQQSGSIDVLGGAEGEVRLVSAAESLARIEALVNTLREEPVALQAPTDEAESEGGTIEAAVSILAPADKVEPEQGSYSASSEPEAQETEPEAPPQPIVLAGVSIGMTREAALENARKELGQTQVEFDHTRPDQNELFNTATYLLDESETELILYFDGQGPNARLTGAFWKASDSEINHRAQAFLEAFESQGLETTDLDGAILAGGQKRASCRAVPINFVGGIDKLTGKEMGLKRSTFGKVLSVQHNDTLISTWAGCEETVLVNFFDNSFSATLVDMRAALVAFDAR